VAIVGGGPAGLWLAVLLARKHAQLANGANGVVITRAPNAPTIHVFEKRQPAGGGGSTAAGTDGSTPKAAKAAGGGGKAAADSKAHGGRSIVLAITQQTSELLRHHLLGPDISRVGGVPFAPTSRIGDLERIFAADFEKYAAAGFGRLEYGADVGDPDALHEEEHGGYDVVVVASGRRTATDEWREARGMQTIVEGTAAAAIFEFWGARPSADGWASVVASASRSLAPAQIFVRPGADDGRGWVWLVGLPGPLSDAIRRGMQQQGQQQQGQQHSGSGGGGGAPQHESLAASLAETIAAAGAEAGVGGDDAPPLPGEAAALSALSTLDASLKAAGAKAGWTEASHWRAKSVIHTPKGANGPTLLIGDACCGRPFWLGSTLNGHFADIQQLALAPCWNAWDWEAEGEAPLRGYLDRMRTLRRCGERRAALEFKRVSAEESAKLSYEAARRGGGAHGPSAMMADLEKSMAAAEMRQKARAVGVERGTAFRSSSMLELGGGGGSAAKSSA
jgi:hypothetical protein